MDEQQPPKNPNEFWIQFQQLNTAWPAYLRRENYDRGRQLSIWRGIHATLLRHRPEDWALLLHSQRTRKIPMLAIVDCYKIEDWLERWLRHFAAYRHRESERNKVREWVRRDPADDGKTEWAGQEYGSLREAFDASIR